MKKILFTTTTNLSTNPRLLKELKLAASTGFEVYLMAFNLGNWSDKTELENFQRIKIAGSIYLSAQKKPLLNWLINTLVWKIANTLAPFFPKHLKINAFAHNKRTFQIIRKFNTINKSFDLVIAHNLGTLYPAYKLSKKHNIPFAFDIEDYHPGEKCSPREKTRREFIMQKLLPKAVYLSYASPLIGKHSLDLIKGAEIPPHLLINNCFSEKEFTMAENNSPKVKFIWFSQNIAPGRGLELLFQAMDQVRESIELHLIGNLYPDFKNEFLTSRKDYIKIHTPMPQAELNAFICQFDVGLAVELKSSDFNRDICLTNKIFAYTQAGLYVLATNTLAQTQFIQQNPLIGRLMGQTVDDMQSVLEQIINKINEIRNAKQERFKYAKYLSWEMESSKLSNLWNSLLKLHK